MDKVAHYEELIMEKIATRAWKKHYGELSEASQKKLVDSGIHNYKKELKGLEKGTDEILKKHKVKVRSGPVSRFVGALDSVKDLNNAQAKDPKTYGYPNVVSNAMGVANVVYNGPSAAIVHFNGDGGNVFYKHNIPKQMVKTLHRAPGSRKNESGVSTKKLDKFDKKYVAAIIKRHEADEIRAGRMKDNTIVDSRIGKMRKYYTSGGHLSPDVLIREGTHVSIAPKGAKEFMTKTRTQTGETGALSTNGINYGKDAIIDKKKAATIRREVGKENSKPPTYLPFLGPQYLNLFSSK